MPSLSASLYQPYSVSVPEWYGPYPFALASLHVPKRGSVITTIGRGGGGTVGGGFVGGGFVAGGIVAAAVGGGVGAVVVSGGGVVAATVVVVGLAPIEVVDGDSVGAISAVVTAVIGLTSFASSSGGAHALAIPPNTISAPKGVAIFAHRGHRLGLAFWARGSSGGGKTPIPEDHTPRRVNWIVP